MHRADSRSLSALAEWTQRQKMATQQGKKNSFFTLFTTERLLTVRSHTTQIHINYFREKKDNENNLEA